MTTKVDYINEIDVHVQAAKLTQGEAAALFQVSRQTLYNWREGGNVNNKFLYRTAVRMANYIKLAVDKEKLPLASNVPKEQRMTQINSILREMATLKPT